MKFETRLEMAVLLLIAALVGGWIGMRVASRSRKPPTPVLSIAPEPAAQPAEAAPTGTVVVPTVSETGASETTGSPTTQPSATTPGVSGNDWERAMSLIGEGETFEARALLTRCLLAAAEGPERERIRQKLDELNAVLFFSRSPSPDCEFFTVQPGDTLAALAKRCGKDYYYVGLIQRINNVDPARLRVGYSLKVPKGRFSALVQKSAHRLIVLLDGHYIKEYSVGLGAPTSPTPEDTFRIVSKEVNPNWYAPDGQVYKFGHPKNILGTRWIGFEAKGPYRSYGIHGTSDPSSIGKDVSNGCIRMLNSDVEELFSMLMEGDEVKIVK